MPHGHASFGGGHSAHLGRGVVMHARSYGEACPVGAALGAHSLDSAAPAALALRCDATELPPAALAASGVVVAVASCLLYAACERRGRATWQKSVAAIASSSSVPYRAAAIVAEHREGAPSLVRAAGLASFAIAFASVGVLTFALADTPLDAFAELLGVAMLAAVGIGRAGRALLVRSEMAGATARATAAIAAAIGLAIAFFTFERHTAGCGLGASEITLLALASAWSLTPALFVPAARAADADAAELNSRRSGHGAAIEDGA